MSMSVDTRQLETVVQFASFIEVITDPKKLKETLENVKVATADYKEKLGLITTKEEADRYLEKARVTLEEAKGFLIKEKAEQDAKVAQLVADWTIKNENVQRTLDTLSKRQAEVEYKVLEAQRMNDEARKFLSEASAKDKAVTLKVNELSVLETKLNEKQAKLNQILG